MPDPFTIVIYFAQDNLIPEETEPGCEARQPECRSQLQASLVTLSNSPPLQYRDSRSLYS
jgi:hypothetical protein